MNKAICDRCRIKDNIKILSMLQKKYAKSKPWIEKEAEAIVKRRDAAFKEENIDGIGCPVFLYKLVTEPPPNCPYVLEHVVNE